MSAKVLTLCQFSKAQTIVQHQDTQWKYDAGQRMNQSDQKFNMNSVRVTRLNQKQKRANKRIIRNELAGMKSLAKDNNKKKQERLLLNES